MRLLVDTQCFLWLESAPHRLSDEAAALLRDARNELLLSAASAWEIAIKHGLGKLDLPEPPQRYVPDRVLREGLQSLAVSQAHALRVASLPHHHRDPFDRLLIAQAQLVGVPILTSDPSISAYEVETLSAA